MTNVIHMIGLHPLVAFGMLVVDMMLFGSDSSGVGWVLSCAVAAAAAAPDSVIMQTSPRSSV